MDQIVNYSTQQSYGGRKKGSNLDVWKLIIDTDNTFTKKYAKLRLPDYGDQSITLNNETILYIEEAIKLYRQLIG